MFILKAFKMNAPLESKIDRKILGPMQAKGCGILGRHTAWRFTNCLMMMHYPNVLRLKTCSGMSINILEGYFGGRGPERKPIWNDTV
jgi:hypothetical protein